jgi:hypothetical protein
MFRFFLDEIFLSADLYRLCKLGQQWTIKISSPLLSIFSFVATLVGNRDHRTHFWKGAIQGPFQRTYLCQVSDTGSPEPLV